MAEPRKYLLDANILIEAHRRYYGFDLCPGFWDAIVRHHQADVVFCIDRIEEELKRGKDELTEWTRAESPKTFFRPTSDPAIVEQFGEIVSWVQSESQFREEAKAEFAAVADGWLIACAKAGGFVVVTHEAYNRDIRKKVQIPNVCRQFQVEYVNTFEMLRELGIRFIEHPDCKQVGNAAKKVLSLH